MGTIWVVTTRPGSTRLGSAWPSSAWLRSARPGQTRLCLACLCSAWFGPARSALAQDGLAHPGVAHIGSTLLDSTRSEDASNVSCLFPNDWLWERELSELFIKNHVLAKFRMDGLRRKKYFRWWFLVCLQMCQPGLAGLSLAWPSGAWLRSAQAGPACPGSAQA